MFTTGFYIYEIEFNIEVDDVFYRSLKFLFECPIVDRDTADKLVASVFCDSEYFVGAVCVGFFDCVTNTFEVIK